jgi:hypothetical protein
MTAVSIRGFSMPAPLATGKSSRTAFTFPCEVNSFVFSASSIALLILTSRIFSSSSFL